MLEPRTQEISLAASLDTADDPQGAPQGLPVAQNIVWNKDRVMSKRGGFVRVIGSTNANDDSLGFVAAGPTLGIIRPDRVVPFTGSTTSAIPLSTNPSSVFEHHTVGTYHGGTLTCAVDQAILSTGGKDYLCVVTTRTTEASGTEVFTNPVLEVHVQVVDYDHGVVVFDSTLGTDTFGGRVVTVTVGGVTQFGIAYCARLSSTSSDLKWVLLPVSTLTLGTPVTVVAATGVEDAALEYDVIVNVAGNPVVAYQVSSISLLLGLRIFNASTGATIAGGSKTPTCARNLSLIELSDGRYSVLARDGAANSWYAHTFAATTTNFIGSQLIGSGSAAPRVVAQYEFPNTPLLLYALVEDSGTNSVLVYVWDTTGVLVVLWDTMALSGLLSRPWSDTTGAVYVAVSPSNSLATGYRSTLVMRLPATVGNSALVGQVAFDETGLNASTVPSSTALTTPVLAPDHEDEFLLATLVDLETPDGVNLTTSVKRVRVSLLQFFANRVVTTATLGNTGYVSASAPLAFDGTASRVTSFVDAPSAPTLVSTATAGVLTGAYSYRVVLEFTDVHGQIQVSPPSPILTVSTVTAKQIQVAGTVAPHLLGDGLAGQRNLRVKLYRTTAGGTSFQLAHTYAVPVDGTWSVSDNVPDASLQEFIYTTGNVLESEPVPPLRFLTSHRNRLVGIRSDTPEVIAYTKETFDPFLPQWHSALTLRVDNADGPPTALASIADKLIVFQPNAIAAFAGQGPDATGSNGDFSQPETIARGVGVADAERASVAVIPEGVVFRHSTGFQLLTPALQVVPFGRAVEDFLGDATVRRSRYLPALHQLWVILEANPDDAVKILVYDVRYGRWSVFTSASLDDLVDVIEHAGIVYLLSTGQLYTYALETHIDDIFGTDPEILPAFETPWFRADRAQAVRLWKVHISGTAYDLTNTTIRLLVYTQQSETSDHDASVPVATYTWDAGELATIPAGPTTLTARMVTQRCQAFRCRVEIESTAANTTEVFRPATVTYDFGVLPSRGKVPAVKRPTAA